MSDTIWRDDPPTEPGLYWVKSRFGPSHTESILHWTPSTNARFIQSVLAYSQFGPRVPDPAGNLRKVHNG